MGLSKGERALWQKALEEGTPKLAPAEQALIRLSPAEKTIASARGSISRRRGLDAETEARNVLEVWARDDLVVWRCGPPSVPVGKGLARVQPGDFGGVDLFGRIGCVPFAAEVKATAASTFAPSRVPIHEADCLARMRGRDQGCAGLLILLSAQTAAHWVWRPVLDFGEYGEDIPVPHLCDLPSILRSLT